MLATPSPTPLPTDRDRRPFAPGSVSLRLYPHSLPPSELARELVDQARLAEAVGFDGIMTSEHHAGFPNYLPTPLLAASWVLAATERIWAAPAPILLPLKRWEHVVEDLAWTAARHPHRVGAGFASGAIVEDFTLSGVSFEDRNQIFRQQLPPTIEALAGRATGLVARDAAVKALSDQPVPVLIATQGPKNGARAGRLGAGILFDSIVGIERATEVSRAHRDAGGDRRVLIRRVWVGEPPDDEVRRQMDRYRAVSSAETVAHWAADGGLVTDTDPSALAERLAEQLQAAHCDALNLRVFHAGIDPATCRAQIDRLGHEVLPHLRQSVADHGGPTATSVSDGSSENSFEPIDS